MAEIRPFSGLLYPSPPQTSAQAQETSINRDLVWAPPRGWDKKAAIIICSDATLYYRSSQLLDKKLMEVGSVVREWHSASQFTVAVPQCYIEA